MNRLINAILYSTLTTVALSLGMMPIQAQADELPPPAARPVDFEKDIHPIFQKACISCHGPESQKNGFRLDIREAALKGGEGQKDILPGDSANSPLVKYVAGLEPDMLMPPKGERLTPEQIGLIRAWIDQGANWPDALAGTANTAVANAQNHWAYKPVACPPPAAVKDTAWVRSPIDTYVLAKLEGLGIAPSPEADSVTLIRRLSLDLTGLPPTPDEVDNFVTDQSPYAYERLVNRLLASPHFGERWGRHWLDVARYADSNGYEKDDGRPWAWRYRNWVIDALNRDMPYDQFVIEQLAGDLLPDATLEQRVATGFHRNTLTNTEGGVDKEQFRVEAVVDRTNTVGAALLGLTFGCAQCHDHKYDAISQREYYSLFAFFNNADEKDIPAPLDAEVDSYKRAKAEFDNQKSKLVAAINTYKPELEKRLPEWEAKQNIANIEWQPLDINGFLSASGASFTKLDDGSVLVGGNLARKDRYMVVANTKLTNITGFRLETLTDPSLPQTGPGRAQDGNFVLTELGVVAAQQTEPNATQPVTLKSAWADYEQQDFPVTYAFDGKQETGWGVGSSIANHTAVFNIDPLPGFSDGTALTFTLHQQYQNNFLVGRFRLFVTTATPDQLALPDNIRAILQTPTDQRNDEQKSVLLDYFGTFDPQMRELKAALVGHQRGEPKPPATLAQTVVQTEQPRETHIHVRGDFLRPGDPVQPTTLAVLPAMRARGATPDRLDLARWIVSPENPLAARVAVNRVWEHFFDRGLVYTSNDWGVRGELPSHPELLDWLANEFVARGWSQKELIRTIVLSSTYRQSSRAREDLRDSDPLNVLLARQSRFRVEAEITRDLYLAVSDLINPAVGGPSVRPLLPPGVAELSYASSVKWATSEGNDRYRRGMYVFFQRTVPYPSLIAFDCPDSNVTCIRRTRSNTPLQALTTLNDPVFMECAQAFGKRIATEYTGERNARIFRAFRNALGRVPSDAELATLVSLMEDQRRNFAANPEAAKQVAGDPALAPEAACDSAAYVSLARVLMNLDEFITRE